MLASILSHRCPPCANGANLPAACRGREFRGRLECARRRHPSNVDEGLPMLAARPAFSQGGTVRRGAVPLVLGEAVTRLLGIHRHHQPVAAHLGQHARCRDACRRCVATDHRQRRHWKTGHAEPVGQHVAWTHGQPRDRTAHSLYVGLMHAATIDLGRRDEHHVVGQRIPADNGEEFLTDLLRQLLGVVQGAKAVESIRP